MEGVMKGTFGNYEILEEIGAGGMAVVYKARQKLLGRIVALKVLHDHLAKDRVFVQRFLREARDAARLQHPNIVKVYDCGEERGRYYIAMEYLEGENLANMVKTRGALPLPQVISIAQQIASALDYAHREGIVHRDVKPSNIIISSDGRATLTDFSIAKATTDASLTATGLFVGTPAYVSPEQAKGAPVDHRADVYSLAIVCYEMLAGRPPFQGDTIAVLHSHAYDTPPPMRSLNPSLPKELEGVIRRGLAKDPLKRYGSAGELARALEMVGKSVSPEKPLARRAAPQPVVGAALLSIMALGIVLGYSLFRGSGGQGTPTAIVVSIPLSSSPSSGTPGGWVPSSPASGPQSTPTIPSQRSVRLQKPVLLRAEPGSGGRLLDPVSTGATLDLVGRWDRGPWVQVCCINGRTGWAEPAALGLKGETLASLPIIVLAPPSTPTLALQPTPTWTKPLPTSTPTRPRPTPTFTPTRPVPTPTFTPTRPVPTPTFTPERPAGVYPAPRLLSPPGGASFSGRREGAVCLEWESVGALGDNEYYVVLIQSVVRGGGVWTDVQQTKDTRVCAASYLLDWPTVDSCFTWSVSVRRLPGDKKATPEDPGELAGEQSAVWWFFWRAGESSPSGPPPPPPTLRPTPPW